MLRESVTPLALGEGDVDLVPVSREDVEMEGEKEREEGGDLEEDGEAVVVGVQEPAPPPPTPEVREGDKEVKGEGVRAGEDEGEFVLKEALGDRVTKDAVGEPVGVGDV